MKIAVVCAHNSGANTGMVTVDRAAKDFFAGRDLQITWMVPGKIEDHLPAAETVGAEFINLFDDASFPQGYDRIVFWGDFIHSRRHWDVLSRQIIEDGTARDQNHAYEILMRCIAMEGEDQNTLNKIAIVGSTFYVDGSEALLDERYQKALKSILSQARCVRLRDPVSAYRANILSGRDATIGLDPAFLKLVHARWSEASALRRSGNRARIGFSYGRSGRAKKYRFLWSIFAGRWKNEGTQHQGFQWIQWLKRGGPEFLARSLSMDKSVEDGPELALDQLSRCDALVTDTYHAFINAWCIGIPATLIGSGAIFDGTSLGSKKKELMALGMHSLENYIFWEQLSWLRPDRNLQLLVRPLLDEERNVAVFRRHQAAAKHLWSILEKEIDLPRQVS